MQVTIYLAIVTNGAYSYESFVDYTSSSMHLLTIVVQQSSSYPFIHSSLGVYISHLPQSAFPLCLTFWPGFLISFVFSTILDSLYIYLCRFRCQSACMPRQSRRKIYDNEVVELRTVAFPEHQRSSTSIFPWSPNLQKYRTSLIPWQYVAALPSAARMTPPWECGKALLNRSEKKCMVFD